MKEKEIERKKSLLSSIATSIQLLQQTESPEAGQTGRIYKTVVQHKACELHADHEASFTDLQEPHPSHSLPLPISTALLFPCVTPFWRLLWKRRNWTMQQRAQ